MNKRIDIRNHVNQVSGKTNASQIVTFIPQNQLFIFGRQNVGLSEYGI